MYCDYVKSQATLNMTITATDVKKFKAQFREVLHSAQEPAGIVYVWRTQNEIPRLRGSSSVIYIGKAKHSFYDRYIYKINDEAKIFWERYSHIISTYGEISIEIYQSSNPEQTENNFLYQYNKEFMELPPINLQSYKLSLLKKHS